MLVIFIINSRMNNEIKSAIDVCKKAQRNYDLTKTISEEDLETLTYMLQL